MSTAIVTIAFFVVFEPEGTSTTEAEAAAEIDACVAFAIPFPVGFLDLQGQLTLSEDTLEVVEAPAAKTSVSAEPAVKATVGSTTVCAVAAEMDLLLFQLASWKQQLNQRQCARWPWKWMRV